jgi:opacity protein-like surface antigen
MERTVKNILAITALITLFSLPSFAAERSAYFSISGGVWLPAKTATLDNNFLPVDISYHNGWSVSGAVGLASDKGLRLENEIVYRHAPGKGTTDSQCSLGWLINIWYDMHNSTPITPYLGGGFGYGRGHQADLGVIDGDGNGVAYQAGGGVDVRLSQGLSLDLGYRYFGIADIYNKSAGGFDLSGSSVVAGLRKTF